MTWQTLIYLFTVLSIAAQAVAVDQVRAWGNRSGQTVARRLRAAWWRLTRHRPPMNYGSLTGTLPAMTMSAHGYALPPDLAADLSGYIAGVDARLASLSADTREHASRLADLESRAERAEALAAEEAAEARLTGAWVIAGAVLATLALLAQVLA